MVRVLALIVGLLLIVFVAASVAKTFFSLALLALIVSALALGYGLFRRRRHSTPRSRSRF